jgi:hypothetical protein
VDHHDEKGIEDLVIIFVTFIPFQSKSSACKFKHIVILSADKDFENLFKEL